MKYPKLKNTLACNLIIYLAVFSPFIVIIIGAIFENITNKSNYTGVFIVAFFILSALDLIYLLRNFFVLIMFEMDTVHINNWKRARLWYETSCNSYDRKSAEKIISKRAEQCGKIKQPVPSKASPVFIRYKRCYSWMQTMAAKEKITLLYSVNHLDKDTYKNILNSANVCSKAVQCKKEDIRFIDKKQRKSPIITAVAVIILADSVSYEIPALARELTNEKQDKLIVPAVVDFAANRYYFNPSKEHYDPSFMSQPARNIARKMIIKTLFAGKLPYKNNKNLVTSEPDGIDLEMSLWDYIKKEKSESQDSDKAVKKIAKKLNDGEVAIDEDVIFCKLGNSTAMIMTFTSEEDDTLLEVLLPDFWIHPKTNTMSKKDKAIVKKKVENFLIQNSYNYKFI